MVFPDGHDTALDQRTVRIGLGSEIQNLPTAAQLEDQCDPAGLRLQQDQTGVPDALFFLSSKRVSSKGRSRIRTVGKKQTQLRDAPGLSRRKALCIQVGPLQQGP